ncbi:type VI secretion system tip protein TssI/VgrG, partial [Achromobacter sp.]|uniref:type VI secretion system Vgr family protein n=1 Tax=Achromobacter sp. TaxID=134375 RepID=UPI003D04459F
MPSDAPAYSTLNIATLSQQARMLRLSTALDAELVVEHMRLREGVSRLFSLTLDCLAASAELDVAVLLGKEISVSLLQADGSMRRWHAVVEGVDALGADGGLARYRLHAAPWMAALALRRDSFVYQDLSVQDIVSEVFSDYPQAAFAFELTEAPKPRPLCTQYRESDLAFVQRILAEAGLSYRFEHQQDEGQGDGGGARHRVVIFDAGAARPEDPASPLRFHRSDATETRDSITRFAAAQSVRPGSVARAAWNERTLTAHAAQSQSQVRVETLPVLEDYDYAGHGRYADDAAAEQSAARSLRAHESRLLRFEGAGTARSLAPGRIFALSQHDRYAQGGGAQAIDELAGNRYVLLEVTHEATNNLGGQAAQVLDRPDLERGTYRNRFSAQPEAAALMPAWRARPTAPEGLAAVVVSANDAPITSDRDLRVKVQFPWQRGEKPLSGGLPQRTHGDTRGNAPGDDRSGTWLRVASAQAGPNWGAHHLPRGGTEVIVEFIDGDIDQPVVAGQLYNDADLPPWSAGEDGDANHAGVLSGWHSQGLDGAGRNQWVFDDTKGKLRTRLASSTAATQLGLGYLVEQGLDEASRGPWRGTGFELRSDAWAVARSGQGMLVSATAREQGKSTQADAQEALLLLRGAQDASRRLNDSAGQRQARPLAAAAGYDELLQALDPEQDGRYAPQVNGQAAGKAVNGQRSAQAHIERINGPHLLVDSPNSLNLATPASAVLHAGEHLHATAQSDAHVAATQTYAAVSARSASVFAQQGPIRAISAQAPVSLHAHTDILEALAGQEITVTSSAEGIEILGNQRVTLQAAGGSVTLDGADILFKGPGLFSVKGATHNFVGPGSDAASLPALPSTTVDDPLIVSAELVHKDGAFAKTAKKAGASLMAGFGGATGALGDIVPEGLGETAASAAGKLSQLAGQANALADLAKHPMGALSAAPGLLGQASPAAGGLLAKARNAMGLVSQAQAMAANPMSALPAANGLLGAVAPGAGGMLDSAASAAGAVSQAAALVKDPMSALPAATDMLAAAAPQGASSMISGAAGLAGMGAGTAGTDAALGTGDAARAGAGSA